jgi:hypothetical protein
MTESNFRALCAELHAAVQLYTGQNPAAAGIPANELVARLMEAMANTAAALAQPEPQGPSELELEAIELKLWDKHRTKGYMGEEFMYDNDFSAALDEYRAALARWGTPATTGEQQ